MEWIILFAEFCTALCALGLIVEAWDKHVIGRIIDER